MDQVAGVVLSENVELWNSESGQERFSRLHPPWRKMQARAEDDIGPVFAVKKVLNKFSLFCVEYGNASDLNVALLFPRLSDLDEKNSAKHSASDFFVTYRLKCSFVKRYWR